MRIENEALIARVSRNVHLRNAFGRNEVHVLERIELVIDRADVNVIDVKQNAAVGALDYLGEKLPLRHLGVVKLRVAADVFENDGTST